MITPGPQLTKLFIHVWGDPTTKFLDGHDEDHGDDDDDDYHHGGDDDHHGDDDDHRVDDDYDDNAYRCLTSASLPRPSTPRRTPLNTSLISCWDLEMCNQCDSASNEAGNMRIYLKNALEKSQTNVSNI